MPKVQLINKVSDIEIITREKQSNSDDSNCFADILARQEDRENNNSEDSRQKDADNALKRIEGQLNSYNRRAREMCFYMTTAMTDMKC